MTFQCPAWPPDWPEINAAINDLIRSGDWGRYRSEHQERLKSALGDQFGVAHVRPCGSGSAALETALRAAGVGVGDEVIVAAYDYPGNYRTIEVVGARPVLVDLDLDSFSLSPDQLPDAAGERVRAVVVSHLYGRPAAVESIQAECQRRGWVLIEDACQVPGMIIDGKPAGRFGHMSTLSFGGTKLLTSGNGGAILTSESRFAAKINSLLDRPSDSQPLSALQCAALLPQLERLDRCNQQRTETIEYLQREINPKLHSWQWLSHLDDDSRAAHYKVAWAARSAEHRAEIIQQATELGLPIGAGFRSMARSSDRRCRKPTSLQRATSLAETVFVLHHNALLLPRDRHHELGECLITLEEQTRPAPSRLA